METNKKQSAFKFILDELEELNLPNWLSDFRPILVKTKKLHKQNIIDAYEAGVKAGIMEYEFGMDTNQLSSEQYYEQTYN